MNIGAARSRTLADVAQEKIVESRKVEKEATAKELDQKINGNEAASKSPKAQQGEPGGTVSVYA